MWRCIIIRPIDITKRRLGRYDTTAYYDRTGDSVATFYCPTESTADHAVNIVGWDDDFNDFREDAPESGAWLIANSYGTNYSKDENGYFWVSYYDPSLCEYYTFEGVSADTYQTIFQYDKCLMLSGFHIDHFAVDIGNFCNRCI